MEICISIPILGVAYDRGLLVSPLTNQVRISFGIRSPDISAKKAAKIALVFRVANRIFPLLFAIKSV